MADAGFSKPASPIYQTAQGAVAVGEVRQLADGRAGVFVGSTAATTGDSTGFRTDGIFVMPKAATFSALDGMPAYWDHSANAINYKRTGDRDFYVGRFYLDATQAATECSVNLNVPENLWDVDLLRDAYLTVPTGTQALGGFLPPQRRGGSLTLLLSTTNEVQKADALGVDTFSKNANAIVRMIFRVVSDGAGAAPDFNIGIANDTHATDADSIANYLFVHLDGNSTNINLQSKDGTTTVAATDTTLDYTEGSALANRVEVWFDLRTPEDVQVYVNGVLALAATVFRLDAAANELRLLAHLEKTAAADVYEVAVDALQAKFSEQ